MPTKSKKQNTKYSVIDLETTGANSFGQKIIEIAIINYDGDKVEEVWSTLINPEKSINHGITMITGITNEMVEGAPKFYEVARKIVEMTEGRVLIAHNVFFDYRFLQREFSDLGYTYKRDVFCTCKTSRKVFPGLPSYSLRALCDYFKINRRAANRALSDAEDCLAVMKKIEALQDIATMREELDHLIPAQLEKFNFDDYPETPGLYFMYDKDNALLYVGKSKNIRGRLKQHFKQFHGMQKEEALKSRVSKVDFLECYHDLPTSLLELHFIKTQRPFYNRAGRRKNFHYGLKLAPLSEHTMPGEELKVTKVMEGVPLLYSFGSKHSAAREKERIFLNAFGVSSEMMNFSTQMHNYKKVLGPEAYYKKLKKHYEEKIQDLPDVEIEKRNWGLSIQENVLKCIWIKDQVFKIEETPDMRSILLSSLKQTFKEIKRSQSEVCA